MFLTNSYFLIVKERIRGGKPLGLPPIIVVDLSYFFLLLTALTPNAKATGTRGISTLANAVPS